MRTPRVRKAVLPVAGLGTRFLPATKAVPKEMLPIVDVPAVQLVVEEALDAGIEEIIVVTGRGKHAIEDHFDIAYELEDTLEKRGKKDLLAQVAAISRRVRVISVRQKEPLGLGHAVSVARQAAGGEPVAVLLGDDLIEPGPPHKPGIAQLIEEWEKLGGESAVIALLEVAPGEEHLYGVVAGDVVPAAEGGDVEGRLVRCRDLVEKPAAGTAPSRLAIIGRYVLPASMWDILERTPKGRGGEIQLTDALKLLATGGGAVYGWRFRGTRHDTGDRLGYLGANLAYALRRDDLRPGLLAMMRELLAKQG